jgi:hypothetical protein
VAWRRASRPLSFFDRADDDDAIGLSLASEKRLDNHFYKEQTVFVN